ncbi:MAG: thymidine phosphorylase [Myxococcota bacterium]
MNPLSIIEKKREGHALDVQDWRALLSSRDAGLWRPYHQAALNTALVIKGFSAQEKAILYGVLAAERVTPDALEVPHIGIREPLFGGQLRGLEGPLDLILHRKLEGEALSSDEIQRFIEGVTSGEVRDEALAAFTMSVFLRGMTTEETRDLTKAMLHSGDVLSWPAYRGSVVDKHSTGGVGDKISLPLAGVLLACGLKVPMLSGRGLGHTGGTLDKLQSIPGFRVDLNWDEIEHVLASVGGMIIGQTSRLAPADRRMYAIRDVCGTVSSIPLITASILSKKLAEGLDALVLDVKTGDGAFMTDRAAAEALAESLVSVGKAAGVTVIALLTDMDAPLGRAVGNANEVIESMACLNGEGPADLEALVVALAAELLLATGQAQALEAALERAKQTLHDGTAKAAFIRMAQAQGADISFLEPTCRLELAPLRAFVRAERPGVIQRLRAGQIGRAVVRLGGGRQRQEDAVLPDVGIQVVRTVGESVQTGDIVLELMAKDRARLDEALQCLDGVVEIGSGAAHMPGQVLKRIL